MKQMAKLDYGDEVRITDGPYREMTGAVVGMSGPETPSTFTIEFGDGSDAELPLEVLERLPD